LNDGVYVTNEGEKVSTGEVRFIFWKHDFTMSTPTWVARNSIVQLDAEDLVK